MRSLETQISWFSRIQLTLAGVIVLAAAAFYVLWYRPATQHMHQLRTEIETNNHSLEVSRSKADELPTVAKTVEDLRQKLARFDRLIPNHQDLPQFLDSLESLKQRAGITKCALKPDNPQSFASYSEQSIHVDFEGDFSQVSEFLANVESMDRMARISHLSLKATDSYRGTVAVQMEVCIYFLES